MTLPYVDAAHASFCNGTGEHDENGNCDRLTDTDLGDDGMQYALTCTPHEDVAVLWLGEAIFSDLGEFDRYLAFMQELRQAFIGLIVESDCQQHEHSDDEDEE